MSAQLTPPAPALRATAPAPAWWRVGMVWLVVGGPAVVVVAAIGTAVVAYRGADPVLTEAPTMQQSVKQLGPQTPAMQARNHAATAPPPPVVSGTPQATPPALPASR